MLSEELHVIGILDENKASGSIKAEDLRALICDYLQLAPYHPVLIEVLTQNNVSLEGQAKVDIHDIFRATNTSYFNQNVPSVNEILEKIVLMAAIIIYTRGLLTMSEIRDGASAHKMKEFENLSVGVACNVQTVHSILWVIRKTINNALLEKWISAHSGVLDQPGLLMAHEFIYLLCNCMSKTEMMDKIPKIPMNPKMDKKTHLFKIDKDFGKTYETPDHKIQHIMSTYYNVDKAYIEGIATKAVVTEKITKKTHRHQPSKNEPNQDDEENLRKQLRGMVMTVGIKVKLKEYHQKLIRSRLNGKSAFDKLIAQAHGQNTLPSPLDLHSQGNLTAGNNLSPKKIWGIPNRPQTAQMFHNKSLSSPFQLNLNTPIKSDRNLQKFLETDSIKGFNSVSANRVPALNTNLPKTPVGRSSRGSINPAILKNMNPRKSSELLSQGLGYQEPEIIPPMERAIDEEFEKFQSQNKSGLKPKAPRRQTYFNSAINPSAARIYSSRPESPQIQASPLASKFFL